MGRKITLDKWLRQSALPKNEARMLLQYALSYTRAQLVTRGTNDLAESVLQTLETLAQRRLKGEPMAYLLGGREFYGRRPAVNPCVLILRPETEHLVKAVLKRLPPQGRVWDLGAGSGAIAVTVALERADADVRASGISVGALDTVRQNAAELDAGVGFAQDSWFDTDRPPENRYDVIVSNPSYTEDGDEHLPQDDLRFEPQNALTDFSDGLSHIRHITQKTPKYLEVNGWLLFEHGYDQGEAVRNIMLENDFAEVVTEQDLAGLDRVTLGRLSA